MRFMLGLLCYDRAVSRLEGRVAVVTGASSGIGAAIAAAFAAEGAAVVGFARRFDARVAHPVTPGTVLPASLDVTSEDKVRARFQEVGPLDILVCCAGGGVFASLAEARVEDLREMLDVHIVGTFLCVREALPQLAVRGGHIITVSSVAAFRTFTASAGYTAAKEGLRGLTRVLTEEARASGVRVTGLYPGAVDTPIWDERPGFRREDMMRPESLASLVVELVVRPELSVEELLVLPPRGIL
jgi:NAD(P)-dependent dehydrogenase (short-subunit alcohol dehydrogenase family)